VRLNDSGDIASILDKRANRELLSAPMRLAFLQEKPQQHPAWNMDWDDRKLPPVGYMDGTAKIRVVENGAARVAVQVERSARGSRCFQTVRLSTGTAGDRIEFVSDIDWQTSESSLKAVFPLAVSAPEATYSEGIGTVQRGNNNPKMYEVPAQEWFDLTSESGGYGVSVLSEAKYGSDKPDDSTLRLTLLYTPGVRGRFQHQATQDWGHHEIKYALQGHAGDWRTARTANQAARFNQPLLVFQTPSHNGERGRTFSFLNLNQPNVTVAALKKAEDSEEVIVRVFETHGKDSSGVRLKTASPITAVREVDGQERKIAQTGNLTIQKGALIFDMKSYRPRAFALTLQKPPPAQKMAQDIPLPLAFDLATASSRAGKTDGAFSADKRSYPGERLPKTLRSAGVTFQLASAIRSNANAVACAGQTVKLPLSPATAPRFLYLLAAAQTDTTTALEFIGANRQPVTVPLKVQGWDGYVGQWHTRLWEGEIPQKDAAVWNNTFAGLTPGYIKRDPVAWYSDQLRLADGTRDPYHFCYLFRYAVPIPDGADSFTLPKMPSVRVFAATVSHHNADLPPADALYDVLPVQ
ncbi:MAG: alpha-mannosidase, partial [Armatimonadetes bacterium]|nr:alpha-mannosidase [Armatimonadota bacterium]